MMPVHTLTELQYSEDRNGPWQLYIYAPKSEYHRPGVWFTRKPEAGAITVALAKRRLSSAMKLGLEVRVCDGGDMLVFHAKDGKVLHGENFWEQIAA